MQGPTTTSRRLTEAELNEATKAFPGLTQWGLSAMERNLARPKPRQKSMFSLNNDLDDLVKSATVSTKKTSNPPTETLA
ncbi:MAG: hypothetical protein PHW76_02510 [Alphaproteobacteria bacterium]|nr:hypothetical protein [Alphaproteobacteria bacterium]